MDNQEQYYKLDLQILNENETIVLFIKGYKTAIRRTPLGHLCGYLEINMNIFQFDPGDIICHGGITFKGSNVGSLLSTGYWIGFDCAHYGDWTPAQREGIYKDVRFVIRELQDVIAQLEEITR